MNTNNAVHCGRKIITLPVTFCATEPQFANYKIPELVSSSRAVEKGDLLPDGNGLDPADWQEEETDVAEHGCRFVQKEECFELLRRCCCVEGKYATCSRMYGRFSPYVHIAGTRTQSLLRYYYPTKRLTSNRYQHSLHVIELIATGWTWY